MFLNRKGFFSFILLMLMFISTSSFAVPNKEFDNASDCGVENKVVKQFSWEICEQDFAFRIFYKLFPDVLEDYVLPIVSSKYLERVKDLESDNIEVYRAYQYSILKIFESILKLSLSFGVFVFIWHAALALLRSATEGSFLGKDYTWKKTGIKYSLIVFGLLPLGHGLVVIHIIVFLFIMFAIAFANLFYSMYLNFMDAGSEAVDVSSSDGYFKETDADRMEAFERMKSYDHNFFYATEYAKKLVKVGLCKLRTEQFIFESNLNTLNSSNADNIYKCSAESTKNSQNLNKSLSGGSGFVASGAFSSYLSQETSLTSGGNKLYITSGVSFGKNLQNNNQCNIDGIYDYNCGTVSVSPPAIADNSTLKVLDTIGFATTYAGISSQVMGANDAAAIENIATAGWQSISTSVINEIGTKINGEIKLSPNNEVMLKNISYYYHQLLLNDALIGASVYQKDSNSLIAPSSNAPISNFLIKSIGISNFIVENYCLDNQEIVKKSNNLVKYLGSFDQSIAKDLSASCLAISQSKPSKVMGGTFDVSSGGRSESESVMLQNTTKGKDILTEMVGEIYNKRVGLERSLFKSLKSVASRSMTEQMRKVGFATAGGMMLKSIKGGDIDNKFLNSFRNSMNFNMEGVLSSMVGKENITTNNKVSSSLDNPNFKPMDAYYSAMVADFISNRKDLRFTDISAYTSSVFNDSLSEAGKMENTTTLIMETVTNPFGSFKTAIGLGGDGEIGKDIVAECMNDLTKCPIPLENPIIHLTDFGNNLIKVSSGLIASSITLAFAKWAVNKNIATKLSKDKGGSVDLSSALNKTLTKSGGSAIGGKVLGFVGSMFNIADMLMAALFDVFLLLLLVGVFFAYIIPLIPFMMFTFAFLSWITMCILALVIAPMWLIFNLKMVEERNGNSEMFRSGYNIAMQILFRPALTIIGLVLGWSLFIVSFLALNLTIVPFMYSILSTDGGSFSINSLIDGLMLIVLYGTMIYVMITYIFKFMYKITNQIFEVLNVQAIDDKANIAEDVMKSALLSSLAKFEAVKAIDGNLRSTLARDKYKTKDDIKRAHRSDSIDGELTEREKDIYKDNKPDTPDDKG